MGTRTTARAGRLKFRKIEWKLLVGVSLRLSLQEKRPNSIFNSLTLVSVKLAQLAYDVTFALGFSYTGLLLNVQSRR